MGCERPILTYCKDVRMPKTTDNWQPVFGVLSNETIWQFFKLNPGLIVYAFDVKTRLYHTGEIHSIIYSLLSSGQED